MFPLKFDLLFPSVASAKLLARKLNGRRKSGAVQPRDPRELQRIRQELRSARDKQAVEAVHHRYHIF